MFSIENLVLRYSYIKSFNFNLKLISSSSSVGTFCISGLNYEHSLSINNILIKKTRAITDCLVSFSVKEISKFRFCDCHVIFTTRNSNFTFFRTKLFKVWSLTLDNILILENTWSINGRLTSKESDSNLSVRLFESSSIN